MPGCDVFFSSHGLMELEICMRHGYSYRSMEELLKIADYIKAILFMIQLTLQDGDLNDFEIVCIDQLLEYHYMAQWVNH